MVTVLLFPTFPRFKPVVPDSPDGSGPPFPPPLPPYPIIVPLTVILTLWTITSGDNCAPGVVGLTLPQVPLIKINF